jgi:hypothetical protein
MSRNTDTSKHKINLKDSYAILQQSTTTTIISKKIMEANEEKTGVRQKSKVVHTKSKLVKDKKTKRQEEKKNFN